jgi:phospholipid/cholesterol/gamma-HCH transport system substrate-binding protein
MDISTGQKVKTGFFVIICLLLLLALLFVIGQQKKLFGNTILVYAYFNNISGTREGNYVRFAGINIGTVETIHIINDTTVQLGLSIEKKMQPYLKTDAVASIGSDGLMGDKLILIAPGNQTSPVVKSGGKLQSTNPLNIDRMMSNLSKVSDNASVLTEGLAQIVDKINSGKGTIGRLLGNDNLAKKMERTIETANHTAKAIDKTAKSVDENMQAAKSNFLLRGYFKKKEKQRIKDSIENAKKLYPQEKKEKE